MDPLTLALIGGGSSLASMFLNSAANNSVNAARGGVMTAERGRQAGLDAEAKGVTDQSLGRYSNFGQQQSADAARIADLYKTPITTSNTAYTAPAQLPPAASGLVNREIDGKAAYTDNYLNGRADKLAALRSFGDTFAGIGRGVAGDAQKVGQIGNFKKGSSNVEQLELDNANNAGNTYKFFGDLAGGVGKAATTAGLSGMFAPAAGAVGANGAIVGAAGPTSVGGAPLVGQTAFNPGVFSTGVSPFLSYGR